ncbi:hypothetical protein Cni_G28336 [Canna indica]|uniref:RING-type E3 ubiquitin transferase n=1 Tax=Canna indica TaxID=4628 RepID=A0AAQ3L6G7_9LILI|nr:hypothetical protein Cni_G28336 [Canna indica]
MDATENQQPWVPYVPTRDCSMGFCSIYCPQWCYVIFPPPPPVEFSDDDSGMTFSPLVIAIISILASAFFLICYYTIISKYCCTFRSLQRWLHSPGRNHLDLDDDHGGQSRRHGAWHASPSNGIDETLISKIAVYKYRRGDGMVQGTDCSVCLSEFREDDSLRLLPKCSHAFHLQCIDTWLRSHSNCPLCRANILPAADPSISPELSAAPEPANSSQIQEAARVDETVIVVEDRCEEEAEHASGGEAAKGASQIYRDSGGAEESRHDIVEVKDDDADVSHDEDRVSIADVLRMSMEDGLLSAKENRFWVGTSSSARRAVGVQSKGGGGRSRGLHGVMSPVPMKRSTSNGSGRFCLTRHGKGKTGDASGAVICDNS